MRELPTRSELLASVRRWIPARRERLCAGIQAGVITIAEAMQAHGLSEEEMTDWYARFLTGGRAALRMQWRETRRCRQVDQQ